MPRGATALRAVLGRLRPCAGDLGDAHAGAAVIVAATMAVTRRDVAYLAVPVWVLIGIALRLMRRAEVPG